MVSNVNRGGRRLIFLAVACAALALPGMASAHPLHTSLAEVLHDSRAGSIVVSLRVFVDDFTTASARRREQLVSRGGSSSRSSLVDYALESFAITDGSGRRVLMHSCGGKRVGDLMWLCFKGSVARGQQNLSIMSKILFDLYMDQINIVKVTSDSRTSNLLFTPGDGAKRIR